MSDEGAEVTQRPAYADRYAHAELERTDGILVVRLHTEGGSLVWGAGPHEELPQLFRDIGDDRDNQVVVLTGTGEDFIAEIEFGDAGRISPRVYAQLFREGRRLLTSLLDIDVPMIAAVNGPARVHAELAVLCDVVLASEDALFQDAPHYRRGLVPGDGVHLVWPLLLGPNRGRYFLLTGQEIDAREARRLGVVSEVLTGEQLMPRALSLAGQIAAQPPRTVRYTRTVLVHHLRRVITDGLALGIALEGLAAVEHWPRDEEDRR